MLASCALVGLVPWTSAVAQSAQAPAAPTASRGADAPAGTTTVDVKVPPTIEAVVRALDADGQPIEGPRSLDVTVWSVDGGEALASESHGVQFVKGRAALAVGSKTPELPVALRSHPEVELEYTIDGQVQVPRVRVLVGGHSPASRAALSGPVAAAPGSRTKAFRAAASQHAVQAVAIQPPGGRVAPEVEIVDGRRVYRRPFEVPVTYLGRSRRLSELPRVEAQDPARAQSGGAREINRPRHGILRDKDGRLFGTTTEKIQDPLVERQTRGVSQPAPALELDFAGVGNVNGVLPPDTEGAVGLDRYVQVVNLSFAIYDKSGTQEQGPTPTNSLWTGFGGLCENDNSGDAIFLYDQFADRFVLTQFTSGNVVCFAVQADPSELAPGEGVEDATFHLYQVATLRFPDYYKVGVWPDPDNNAYFFTTNSGFAGQYDVYAVDRASMLDNNVAAPAQVFQNFDNLFLPADVDGPTAPPAMRPGLFYTILDGGEPYFSPVPAQDSIELYEFDVDWGTPGNSTFSQLQSLTSADGLADFNWTVCGFFASSCLPQPDTGQRIDSASWWPMQRFVYRNFGSHESLLGTWTVDVTGEPDLAAPRWFELRYEAARSTAWEFHQQGTYSPDNEHRFMPSAAMDANGNIALGYSVTSSTTYPSIRYAVHEAGSALGSMSDEASMTVGTGSQTSGSGRWGDYSSMEIDPADDCTFWFTTEYVASTGGAPWLTRVGTFRMPGCGIWRVTPPSQAVCTTEGSVDFELELLEVDLPADLSVFSGCPSGATCSFSPSTVETEPGESTFTVSDLGSASSGEYTITLRATEAAPEERGAQNYDKDVLLTLFETAPAVPTLLSPADEATGVAAKPATLSWTDVGASSYTVQIATDPSFSNIVDERTVSGTSRSLELDTSTVYYWRVRADNTCGTSGYSTAQEFSTLVAPGDCPIGQVPVTVFEEGMEGATPEDSCPAGWTCDNGMDEPEWILWSNRVFAGTRAINAASPVPNAPSEQHLVSPSIVLAGDAQDPTLRFWTYQEIENRNSDGACRDGGLLEISLNGGGWQDIDDGVAPPEILTDPYDGGFVPAFTDNPLVGNEAWCGDPQDWTESVFDLAPYVGNSIRFRFRFGSDNGGGILVREGWSIDELSVRSCVLDPNGPLIFADDFESGDTLLWQ